MSKLLVVFGATGNQGRSVVDSVLDDPELSKRYKIRAVTRDPSKASAQELASKGAEVVQGDVDDEQSIKKCVEGADFAFILVPSVYTRNGYDIEFRQSKAIAGAFVAAGGEYLIYSSVPSPAVISDGRYKNVFLFEVKADVQKYISKLPIKSAFFVPGSLMQNYQTMMVPKPAGDGTFAIFDIVSPDMLWPLIDVRSDTGKFVAAILADPTAYVGKELSAATKLYSWSGITESLSKATGQTVRYVQMPVEQWRSFMPPDVADSLVEMRKYMDEFGYYGADTRAKVQWSAEQARGNLTTLDEYLQQNPISLKGPS